ncbi:MAG TPA: hypothetical protein VLH19_01870 [Patescibacteria group bacterium]|nr:hypothetical protein [Patescibacteria group bacterium]
MFREIAEKLRGTRKSETRERAEDKVKITKVEMVQEDDANFIDFTFVRNGRISGTTVSSEIVKDELHVGDMAVVEREVQPGLGWMVVSIKRA